MLLDELADVLARPKFASATRSRRAGEFVEALRLGSTMVEDPPAAGAITRDADDDYLVRLARASAASVLVSGDGDLLDARRS